MAESRQHQEQREEQQRREDSQQQQQQREQQRRKRGRRQLEQEDDEEQAGSGPSSPPRSSSPHQQQQSSTEYTSSSRRRRCREAPAGGAGSPSPSTAAVQGEERYSDDGSEAGDEAQAQEQDLPELSLQVLWTSVSGRTKLTQLPLVMMPRWDCTSGVHKRLVSRVFSDGERPASLTCSEYLQFNTSEECLQYPLDIARTLFRLVAAHEGWQYVIHESPQHPRGAQHEFLHVVSIEFETVARVIGHLGIRMPMIAYPIVAINKAKLMEAVSRMRTDPGFKGIL